VNGRLLSCNNPERSTNLPPDASLDLKQKDGHTLTLRTLPPPLHRHPPLLMLLSCWLQAGAAERLEAAPLLVLPLLLLALLALTAPLPCQVLQLAQALRQEPHCCWAEAWCWQLLGQLPAAAAQEPLLLRQVLRLYREVGGVSGEVSGEGAKAPLPQGANCNSNWQQP